MLLNGNLVVVLVGLLCILSAVEPNIIQPSNSGVVPGAYIAEFENEFDHVRYLPTHCESYHGAKFTN